MSRQHPTTQEFLVASPDDRDHIEQEFFNRISLSNGTAKTTKANRLTIVNRAVLPHIRTIPHRPVQIMDVGASSGISTVEWYEDLARHGIDCDMIATDLLVDASVLSFCWGLSALMDSRGNFIHFDLLGRGMLTTVNGPMRPIVVGITSPLRMLFRVARRFKGIVKCETIRLISKRFAGNRRLQMYEDDLFVSDRSEFANRFDVLRAANILNRCYFPCSELRTLVGKIKRRLRQGGLFVVCRTDSSGRNNGGIFRLSESSRFDVADRIGTGSEIEDIVLTG